MRRFLPAACRAASSLTALVVLSAIFTVPMTQALARADCASNDPCTEQNCSSALAYPLGAATARMLPPDPFRAKDFAIIKFNGVYHLFYTLHDRTICGENDAGNAITFGHSTSTDLENWTSQGTVLLAGPHPWDGYHLWAPTLIQKDVYLYMFFTGVDGSLPTGQQRIGGARIRTDIHPDLHSGWTEFPAGSIDQPNPLLTCGTEIPGCLCGPSLGAAAEVRDPFVMRDVQLRNGESTPGWLMYYVTKPQNLGTGTDLSVNVSRASYDDPTRWTHLTQLRATHFSSNQWSHKVESPHLVLHGSTWYLFFSGDQGIDYVTGTNPLGDLPNDWGGFTVFPTALGTAFASFHPENWFASEYLQDGTHEYLAWVHDFNPPLNDPLCSTVGCQEVRPVEFREMLWTGSTFTLADPSPVRAADWVQSFTGHNCYCDLGLTILDAKNRTANMVAVRILPDNSEQIYPMSAVGFPGSVNLGTATSLNLHYRIHNPDLYNDFRFKVRITNQPKVVESDVIEIAGDLECPTGGGGGGGPMVIPESQAPAGQTDLPNELALSIQGGSTPGQVKFHIDLPSAGHVKLELFDAGGRRVRTLVDEYFQPGRMDPVWDGRDDHAATIGAGVYFARMTTPLGERKKRVILQR
jgi:glycosyl hydrolase family 32